MAHPPIPGAVEGSPLQASVSPTVQLRVPMAWNALSGGEGVMTLPTGAEEPRGLSACPLWAPAEPAPVPFLNINEQAQECPPHSWLRAAGGERRAGGVGGEEMARRPSQTHLPLRWAGGGQTLLKLLS